MRFLTFTESGRERPGFIIGDAVAAIDCASLAEYIALPPGERAERHGERVGAVNDVTFSPAIRPHKNVFCVGRNYLEHAKEGAAAAGRDLKLPDVPTFFTKAPTALAAHEQTLHFSQAVSKEYDWEAELAIVIGKRVRDIAETQALEAVFGYTCLNDVTARDLQRSHLQWFKGKSLDGSCPLGPWIVTPDEIGDAQRLDLALRVNGVEKQRSNTSQMIFSIASIIAHLSKGLTLEPGDVIATGTPAGVGFARTPPEFLRDGDVIDVDIQKIGILRSRIRLG